MATDLSSRFDLLVGDLLEAIDDDGLWEATLTRLGDTFSADLVAVHDYDHAHRSGVLTPVRGLEPDYLADYRDHYAATNVWMQHGREQMRPGAITLSHRMYPDELLPRTEWYADWLRPQCLFHSMGVVIGVERDLTSTLIFVRQPCQGNYGEEEQRLLVRLGPHIERTMRLRRRLAAASLRGSPALAAFEHVPFAVVFLAETGEVVATNSAASALLAEADGILLSGHRLAAVLPSDRAALQSAVDSVLTDRRPGACAALTLRRGVARPALELWLARLATTGSSAPHRAAAVVFISAPERAGRVDEGALRALFGFTPAEARVGAALVRGEAAPAVARSMGISALTVRSHLKSILRKTGTARQAELVKHLVSGVASLIRAANPTGGQ